MRMLALPAALLLGAALYSLFPGARIWLSQRLRALPGIIEQNIIERHRNPDPISILFIHIVGLIIFPTLISILHPVCSVLVMAPLFTGFSLLPAAAKTKQELDSGKFSKNIPEYERRVLAACTPLGEAFSKHVITPMLLCALGMVLHLGCALGWLYAGLCAMHDEPPQKALSFAWHIGNSALCAMFFLCSGLVGRNPLNVGGTDSGEKLMHLLSLEGEGDHAPIAGDITQAIFLCCLCTGILCLGLTAFGLLIL